MKNKIIQIVDESCLKTIPNTSVKFATGTRHKTAKCGHVMVKAKVQAKKASYLCVFPNGYLIVVEGSNLGRGHVYNPYYPAIEKRGYIGVGRHRAKDSTGRITKSYATWKNMLVRCYSKKEHIRHPTYVNCVVDRRWWNFQNFCEDIQYLENYNLWKENTKAFAWHLDKDIKIEGNKVYSKDTCMFTTLAQNNIKSHVTGKKYVGFRLKDNYSEEFINQSAFTRKYGLSHSCINRVLKGTSKSHKGWTFRIKEEEEKIIE